MLVFFLGPLPSGRLCFGLPCSFQRGASSEAWPVASGQSQPKPEKDCCSACCSLPPQLMLPDGITVEVIVVNQVNAGHLFVQQHTHPTFHALRSLDHQMYLCYSQPGIPTLPTPVESKCCPGGQREPWALARPGQRFWGSPVLPLVLTRRRLIWDPSRGQHP